MGSELCWGLQGGVWQEKTELDVCEESGMSENMVEYMRTGRNVNIDIRFREEESEEICGKTW